MSHFDFDRAGIADRYDRGRNLPPETIQVWLDEIARHVPATARLSILDLGPSAVPDTLVTAGRVVKIKTSGMNVWRVPRVWSGEVGRGGASG